MSTNQPCERGWCISSLTQTLIYFPRHSPFGEVSTCSTLAKVRPMASALVLFMCVMGMLCSQIQNVAQSKVAASTDSCSVGLQRPIRYLSNDHGCCARILKVSASSEKRSRTVLDPRSRILNSWIERHMLLSVLDSASMLTRRLVKSFAIRTLVLFFVVGASGTV